MAFSRAKIFNVNGAELYSKLKKFVVAEADLRKHSFPMPTGQVGRASVVNDWRFQPGRSSLPGCPGKKKCTRCGVVYPVDHTGMPQHSGVCVFHTKKPFTSRGGSFHGCCRARAGSQGCATNRYHVDEFSDPNSLTGFVKTGRLKSGLGSHPGVFALDCEMCLTTAGPEVCKVTLLDETGSDVIDSLVKPENPVLDYNTRFHGLTESSLRAVTVRLKDVHARLLDRVNENSILIGHSLEHDLQVLRVIHGTVIDTSLVFPHREGLPKRRALRNLTQDHLGKTIQQGGRHDSREDALACLELMAFKISTLRP